MAQCEDTLAGSGTRCEKDLGHPGSHVGEGLVWDRGVIDVVAGEARDTLGKGRCYAALSGSGRCEKTAFHLGPHETLGLTWGPQKEVANQVPQGVATAPATAPALADPWQHRSQGMRCSTCMWFVRKAHALNTDNPRGALGRCRRHAPTMSGYPAVFATDWCGDHKIDEGKL